MNDTQKSAKRATTTREGSTGFTREERAAMRERTRESKAASDAASGEADVQAKIAEMPEPDRALAERVHTLVRTTAPDLVPRTYYGMPAYANQQGKIVCFFKPASKFKERYSTVGFEQAAHLDEGTMWASSYALTDLTAADEARIVDLVKKATS